ncbi:MAG: zinc-binding dehydrogenase [Anaerolineae bacterium]|nr:zinc-binding dehydrogenase [Anaerolineae bacterium]
MKKAVILGERQAGLVEAPTPQAKEDWALVKVQRIPMCTEYKVFVAGRKSEFLGHEAVGEVVEVAQPCRVAVGERVVVQPLMACGQCVLCIAGDYIHCQNAIDIKAFTGSPEGSATYAQYVLKPSWMLSKIPDGVSYEMAGLALCALGPSFGGLDAMQVDAFDTVLITGLGPVGLGGVVNARYRGARVIAVESIPYRVEKARQLGADAVIDPRDPDALAQIMELTHGLGVDKALDCSGVVAAQRLCIDAARRKGQVTFVGECSDPLPIVVSPDMIRKGLTLRGSWHYNLNLYPRVMQVIQRSPLAAELISHRFGMNQVQQALEVSASHQCAKIMLDPWA